MSGLTEVATPVQREPFPPPPMTQAVAAPKLTTRPDAAPSGGLGRTMSRLAPFAAAAFFALALWGVHRALLNVSYRTVWHAILSVSWGQIALAIAFTIVGYVALTGYDVLTLRYLRHPLGYARTGLASFISFSFSNTVAPSLLTGASMRTRLYSMWGRADTRNRARGRLWRCNPVDRRGCGGGHRAHPGTTYYRINGGAPGLGRGDLGDHRARPGLWIPVVVRALAAIVGRPRLDLHPAGDHDCCRPARGLAGRLAGVGRRAVRPATG